MDEFGQIGVLEISFGVLDGGLLLMLGLEIGEIIAEGEWLDISVKVIDKVEILFIFFVL